jgi:hypothetical protein
MKARRLIEGAFFGPEALKTITRAFEEAWSSIGSNFGTDPQDVDKARLRLATALLSVASDHSRDVDALKRAGLEAMALNYRKKFH